MKRFASAALLLCAAQAEAAPPATFQQAFAAIRARPIFAHTTFGVEIYALDQNKPLFTWNGSQFFLPASTTKLLTEGTALGVLGPEFRFHTGVYRTGEIRDGVLHGDLVLVASGDPNLSNRIQPDGSLAFENEDHSYGGFASRLVPGAQTAALDDLARQIHDAGIARVDGKVVVDVSLFPEGDRELGTGMVISPICVNDNIVDLLLSPGDAPGKPARLKISPTGSDIRFVNRVVTVAAGARTDTDRSEVQLPDGGAEVTMTGTIEQGRGTAVLAYGVPSPSHFAAALLTQSLQNIGVAVDGHTYPQAKSSAFLASSRVAEHVSPPLREEAKVTLKVSQNLHASMTPFILGAYAAHATDAVEQAGFRQEHDFLVSAGLDTAQAMQADGAGGNALYTPDFMVHYLAFQDRQPYREAFRHALPILGRDGTVFNIQTDSPAAGQVFAKTGTDTNFDKMNARLMVTAKALAGYTTTPSGENVAFAVFFNNVAPVGVPSEGFATQVGQAVGELAGAIHLYPVGD
jgi:D-alanyl-D-alanine carboxypeptidase/D-alanyl-D-alanine-endopeptidase (penicillin-binding protein 4)